MARRFFTADFHLSMRDILRFENRPFKSIEKMDAALLRSCTQRAKADDTIIHIGDLYSYGFDRGNEGSRVKPADVIKNIPAQFINIRGNHDMSNRVKSLCESMTIRLGKRYPDVVVGHYPSYDDRARQYARRGWICLCGHVHSKWKHCLDLDRQILNLNMGVDVWRYQIVSEDELIAYIGQVLSHKPDEIFRCKKNKDGKIEFRGNKSI